MHSFFVQNFVQIARFSARLTSRPASFRHTQTRQNPSSAGAVLGFAVHRRVLRAVCRKDNMSEFTTECVVRTPSAPLPCPRCGAIDNPALGPGSGPHTASARCRDCGHFLQWLSTRSPEDRQARRQQARLAAMAHRPPSPRQLAYLAALGDPEPPPATMVEASTRIDARVCGEGGR